MTPRFDRRRFVGGSLGLTAWAATGRAPADAPPRAAAPVPGLKDNRVLVVVRLAGGNAGLNTVVPFADDAYFKARPRLAVGAKQVLKLTDRAGLHPATVELKRLYDDGLLGIVQNVGYPNPDRSHVRATEIWETASPADRAWATGWLGRYFDAECRPAKSALLGLHLGNRPARAFAHPRGRAVALADPDGFGWPERGPVAAGMERLHRVEPTGRDALDFVQRTAGEPWPSRAASVPRPGPARVPPRSAPRRR